MAFGDTVLGFLGVNGPASRSDQPDAGGGPFTITEQTGEGRSIVLTGRSLPYRPLSFSGEQRMELTEYPGSPVLSAQILGAKEHPTTINGTWKDRYLVAVTPTGKPDLTKPVAAVDGKGVTSAVALAKLFDDVRRKGQLLQVVFGPFLRLGFLQKFEFDVVYPTDIKWHATFAWISQGDPNVGAGFGAQLDQSQTKSGLDGLISQARGGLSKIQGALSAVQDQVDGWLAKIDAVDSLVQQVGATIGQVIDLAATPDVAAARARSIYGAIVDNCQAFEDDVRSHPTTSFLADSPAAIFSFAVSSASRGSTSNGGNPVPATSRSQLAAITSGTTPTAGRIASAAKVRRSLSKPMRDARYAAARARVAAQAHVEAPQLLAQFKAKQATDLRVLCALYYGTPDGWRQLGFFNDVRGTSLVPAGTLVGIPRTLPTVPGTVSGLSTITNAAPSL